MVNGLERHENSWTEAETETSCGFRGHRLHTHAANPLNSGKGDFQSPEVISAHRLHELIKRSPFRRSEHFVGTTFFLFHKLRGPKLTCRVALVKKEKVLRVVAESENGGVIAHSQKLLTNFSLPLARKRLGRGFIPKN